MQFKKPALIVRDYLLDSLSRTCTPSICKLVCLICKTFQGLLCVVFNVY